MEKFARTAHYISELLFVHDCVIVPSFGGFVCSYAPAKVHPAQHVFTPPSKQVFFNKHLQNNDGLLVNAIATAVPCSFEEAQKDVRLFTDAIQQELNHGRKVELPHLGTLSVDPEGNISFESAPDVNFLIESFGLSSFQSMPILREGVVVAEKVEKVEKKEAVVIHASTLLSTGANEEPAKEKAQETIAAPATFRLWRAAAFIAIPLLAASLVFTLNDNFRGAALAGLGISPGEPTLYTPKTYFTKESLPVKETVKPDGNGNYTLSLDESSPGIVANIYKVAPDSLSVESQTRPDVPVVTPLDNSKYYVIGGAFGVAENAENYRKALVAKGYKPTMLDNMHSKLTHISLATFNTKEEAAAFLSLIKADLPDAWILKQK